ncbi:YhcN/YlaJ family sporulation lipoprotein [Paenibacillus validus]|uniref:Sporulation protein n=1 Tax=Paenibacillus validus TaxID=44253 RepID=A0A7X3CS50_9BACL|nr:YhcN/YlaJ family sporulation lipoprotein [Paenibacillus validus]MUG69642.1 hypothetical protein [Paenibacillus validus]
MYRALGKGTKRIGLVSGVCLLVLAGCAGNKPGTSSAGGGLNDHRQQALFDRDSRNNEDASLGVKPRWIQEQENRQQPENGGRTQLDMTNRHLAKTMGFEPGIASRIADLEGVQAAQVLLTEVNAYVAVVLDGHKPDEEANPDTWGHHITAKGGAGLFGAVEGTPNRISWTENGGLGYGKADEIRKLVLTMAPSHIQDVYVSANPNFVQRVRFYANEEQERGTFADYTNEFNTMIQYVFPDNGNTRK